MERDNLKDMWTKCYGFPIFTLNNNQLWLGHTSLNLIDYYYYYSPFFFKKSFLFFTILNLNLNLCPWFITFLIQKKRKNIIILVGCIHQLMVLFINKYHYFMITSKTIHFILAWKRGKKQKQNKRKDYKDYGHIMFFNQ